jgi:hypothetical protein
MIPKVIDYVRNLRQCFDNCWLADFKYHGIWFALLFDNKYQLMCVYYEVISNKKTSLKCELSHHDSNLIYKSFLHKVS